MRIGDYVRYIHPLAMGDPHHPACENGYISSVQTFDVYVIFPNQILPEAVHPKYLLILEGT